jgi:pseudaminic acid biosynthesis-associated protein pseG
MSKRKVIFRADAGPTTGFGHFMRSLALAGYLNDDFECVFTTYNAAEHKPSEYQLEEISRVCRYFHIEAATMQEFDDKFVETLNGDEIVVLDNYYFTAEYQQRIKERSYRLVCIDDIPNRRFVADVFITPSPIERSKFYIDDSVFFLGGLKYALLRMPFLNSSEHVGSCTAHGRLVIALGGADPYRLTDKILQILYKISSKYTIDIIAGDTVRIDNELAAKVNIHRRLNGSRIATLFGNADIGIFSASTVCVEAIACGLPVAAGWYVDNQKEFYDYGVANSLFAPLGSFMDCETILEERLRSVLNASHHKTAPKIDFQQGKEEIIELFKNL